MKSCESIVESFDIDVRYDQCVNNAKYKISYINTHNNKKGIKYVCGIHRNSFIAWGKRVKKITGFDAEIIICKI